jgi:hypothetical protein
MGKQIWGCTATGCGSSLGAWAAGTTDRTDSRQKGRLQRIAPDTRKITQFAVTSSVSKKYLASSPSNFAAAERLPWVVTMAFKINSVLAAPRTPMVLLVPESNIIGPPRGLHKQHEAMIGDGNILKFGLPLVRVPGVFLQHCFYLLDGLRVLLPEHLIGDDSGEHTGPGCSRQKQGPLMLRKRELRKMRVTGSESFESCL